MSNVLDKEKVLVMMGNVRSFCLKRLNIFFFPDHCLCIQAQQTAPSPLK